MKLLQNKTIGDIVHVNANFGTPLLDVERLMKKSQGGGTLLDLGIYTLNAVTMIYGGEKPQKIAAVGHLNEDGKTFIFLIKMLLIFSIVWENSFIFISNLQKKIMIKSL